MLQINATIEGEITGIAFGGEGIMRHANFVIFVPFTIQGEKVACRLTEVHASFARGEIVTLIKASPLRQKAKCPYFGTCGGCQFQHIEQAEQTRIKRQLLIDALERIGKFKELKVAQVRQAKVCWSYRRHVALHLFPQSKGYSAGYIDRSNLPLAPIEQCPIFIDSSCDFFTHLQALVAQLDAEDQPTSRVTVFKFQAKQFICHFQFSKLPLNFAALAKEALAKKSAFAGIIASTPKESFCFGAKELFFSIDTLNFLGSPLSFIQNHPEQSAELYRRIQEFAKALNPKKILDLYCGIGVASVMLAKCGFTTIGVEYSAEAIKMAQVNANNNGISGIRFMQADVKNVLPALLRRERPDFVIVNPPRKGLAGPVVNQLIKWPPKDLLYISCMPATLARDLKLLCAQGYAIVECHPFDMFPQTTHLETLVHLQRVV